jgi:hypothetical protein
MNHSNNEDGEEGSDKEVDDDHNEDSKSNNKES